MRPEPGATQWFPNRWKAKPGKARRGKARKGKKRGLERERGSRGGSGGRVNGEGRVGESDEAKNMQSSK